MPYNQVVSPRDSRVLCPDKPVVRIWPHGQGSITLQRKASRSILTYNAISDNVPPVPQEVRDPEGFEDIGGLDRPRKGLKGITPYGQNMVKSGAYLLECVYGRENLAFATTTLPGSPELTSECASKWYLIQGLFLKYLRRELKALGLPDLVVGVTEIQPKRQKREGGMPLHLHLVYVFRQKNGPVLVTEGIIKDIWKRCICNYVPEMKGEFWGMHANQQQIEKSVVGYLGKYLTKGQSTLRELLEKRPEQAELLPNHWWFMTKELKEVVWQSVVYGELGAEEIERDCMTGGPLVSYTSEIYFEVPGDSPEKKPIRYHLGYRFQLSRAGEEFFCLTPEEIRARWLLGEAERSPE